MKINSLAHLKRTLHEGAVFRVLQHTKWTEAIGLIREVASVQKNAVYTKIQGQPEHKLSVCNGGRGLRMGFDKASAYRFGDTVRLYTEPGNEESLLYEIEILEEAD